MKMHPKISRTVVAGGVTLFLLALFTQTAIAVNTQSGTSSNVKVGVRLVNIEKVDFNASSYRLDFYLWFRFNASEISIEEVKNFEFVNGESTRHLVNEDEGYLQYRVKGDFVEVFDSSQYPFETHKLAVQMEHKDLDINDLIFEEDAASKMNPDVSVAGWELRGFQTSVSEHSCDKGTFSRFVFSVALKRPGLLPLAVIIAISLLTFFMAPKNFAQRIILVVTSLLVVMTIHLSLVNGIAPTGHLTLVDRVMLSVYTVFLYNLATSFYSMRLVVSKKMEAASEFNKKTLYMLPALLVILLVVQIIL